jgi:hypothetical protein
VRAVAAAGAALLVILLVSGRAWADSYTVGTTSDPASPTVCPSATASCSLRQIIAYIHANPFPPDTITLPAGDYKLDPAQGSLKITDSMSILGAGARSTTVEAQVPADRSVSGVGDHVFYISTAAGQQVPTVTISGVKIAGGTANCGSSAYAPLPLSACFGGNLFSQGVLTLNDDWITNGYACSGAGVANYEGTMTVERTLIAGNSSACGGGDSGGIENFGCPASGSGTLNCASGDMPGHLVIDNSTIANNDARLVGGVFQWNDATNTISINSTTIAGNASKDEIFPVRPSGGGLGVSDAGVARIRNSIVANNVQISGTTTTPSNCFRLSTITSLGRNLDSDPSTDCGFTSAGDKSNVNPLLGPLQNNGGPTNTMALSAGSPAIDQIPAVGAGCPSIDQRGVPRPQGPACDMGAFERGVPPTCSSASAQTAAGGSTVTVSLSCHESATGPLTYTITTPPAHGTLGLIDQSTGAVSYTPNAGFFGTDTFTYTGSDTGGTSSPATVTITIPPPPPPACAAVSAQTAPGGSTITIPLSCSGSPAAGMITYAIVTGPAHGSLGAVNQATHSVAYTPKRNFFGQDTFTYKGTASGEDSAPATVTVNVPPPPKLGPTATWAFGLFRRFSTVASMIVSAVLPGSKVIVSCAGHGCRRRSHTFNAPTKQRICSKARKGHKARCRTVRLKSDTIKLTSYFKGWHLGIGARVTLSIVKTGFTGKVYIFGIRGSRDPSVKITCLLPGSSKPGEGC